MREIYRGRQIVYREIPVRHDFIGGDSDDIPEVVVTVDGRDVTDQVMFLGTSPRDAIDNAKELIDGGVI